MKSRDIYAAIFVGVCVCAFVVWVWWGITNGYFDPSKVVKVNGP